jgi:hypothetical protein
MCCQPTQVDKGDILAGPTRRPVCDAGPHHTVNHMGAGTGRFSPGDRPHGTFPARRLYCSECRQSSFGSPEKRAVITSVSIMEIMTIQLATDFPEVSSMLKTLTGQNSGRFSPINWEKGPVS